MMHDRVSVIMAVQAKELSPELPALDGLGTGGGNVTTAGAGVNCGTAGPDSSLEGQACSWPPLDCKPACLAPDPSASG